MRNIIVNYRQSYETLKNYKDFDFDLYNDKIYCRYFSTILLAIVLIIFVLTCFLIGYNSSFKIIGVEEFFIIIPVVLILGILLLDFIVTRKVIDLKNKLVYSEFLIFENSICRYDCISTDDIVAVGNDSAIINSKRRGIHYIYSTCFLLKDGKLKKFYEFGTRYNNSIDLTVVVAHHLNKPFCVIRKDEKLVPVYYNGYYKLSNKKREICEDITGCYIILVMLTFFFLFLLLIFLGK